MNDSQYGSDGIAVKSDEDLEQINTQITEILSEDIGLVNKDSTVSKVKTADTPKEWEQPDESSKVPDYYQDHNLMIHKGRVGYLIRQGDESYFEPISGIKDVSSEKISLLSSANQNSLPGELIIHLDNHKQHLDRVKPTYLPMELIDINLGERWLN